MRYMNTGILPAFRSVKLLALDVFDTVVHWRVTVIGTDEPL
jgi:hypothetical protein